MRYERSMLFWLYLTTGGILFFIMTYGFFTVLSGIFSEFPAGFPILDFYPFFLFILILSFLFLWPAGEVLHIVMAVNIKGGNITLERWNGKKVFLKNVKKMELVQGENLKIFHENGETTIGRIFHFKNHEKLAKELEAATRVQIE